MAKNVKDVVETISNGLLSPDIIELLPTLSTEQLVNMACERTRVVEKYKEDLKAIEEIVRDRPEFPGIKNEEEYQTHSGERAIRKVTNEWMVDAQKIPALQKKLGMTYPEYVTEVHEYAVDVRNIEQLQDALGRDFDRFIITHTGYKWTPKFRADVQRKDNSAFGKAMDKFILVITKIRVMFKPRRIE